jgi:hypothetical protein
VSSSSCNASVPQVLDRVYFITINGPTSALLSVDTRGAASQGDSATDASDAGCSGRYREMMFSTIFETGTLVLKRPVACVVAG